MFYTVAKGSFTTSVSTVGCVFLCLCNKALLITYAGEVGASIVNSFLEERQELAWVISSRVQVAVECNQFAVNILALQAELVDLEYLSVDEAGEYPWGINGAGGNVEVQGHQLHVK